MTKYKKKILNVGLILDNPDNISYLTNELINLSKSQSNYKIKTIYRTYRSETYRSRPNKVKRRYKSFFSSISLY